MVVLVNGEERELTAIGTNGVEWTHDLLAEHDAISFDEEKENYVMDEEFYDWWSNVIDKMNEVQELEDELKLSGKALEEYQNCGGHDFESDINAQLEWLRDYKSSLNQSEYVNPGIVINIVDGCAQGIYDGETVIKHPDVNGYQIEQYVHGPAIAEFDYASAEKYKDTGIPIDEVNKILKDHSGISFADNAAARETLKKLGNQTIIIGNDGNIEFRSHPEYKVVDMESGKILSPAHVADLIKSDQLQMENVIDENRKREILAEQKHNASSHEREAQHYSLTR